MSCESSMRELYNAILTNSYVKIQMSGGISTLKEALNEIYQKIVVNEATNKNKLILVDGENLYNRLKKTKAGEGEKIRGENALADYKEILTELNKKEGLIVVVASHFYLFKKLSEEYVKTLDKLNMIFIGDKGEQDDYLLVLISSMIKNRSGFNKINYIKQLKPNITEGKDKKEVFVVSDYTGGFNFSEPNIFIYFLTHDGYRFLLSENVYTDRKLPSQPRSLGASNKGFERLEEYINTNRIVFRNLEIGELGKLQEDITQVEQLNKEYFFREEEIDLIPIKDFRDFILEIKEKIGKLKIFSETTSKKIKNQFIIEALRKKINKETLNDEEKEIIKVIENIKTETLTKVELLRSSLLLKYQSIKATLNNSTILKQIGLSGGGNKNFQTEDNDYLSGGAPKKQKKVKKNVKKDKGKSLVELLGEQPPNFNLILNKLNYLRDKFHEEKKEKKIIYHNKLAKGLQNVDALEYYNLFNKEYSFANNAKSLLIIKFINSLMAQDKKVYHAHIDKIISSIHYALEKGTNDILIGIESREKIQTKLQALYNEFPDYNVNKKKETLTEKQQLLDNIESFLGRPYDMDVDEDKKLLKAIKQARNDADLTKLVNNKIDNELIVRINNLLKGLEGDELLKLILYLLDRQYYDDILQSIIEKHLNQIYRATENYRTAISSGALTGLQSTLIDMYDYKFKQAREIDLSKTRRGSVGPSQGNNTRASGEKKSGVYTYGGRDNGFRSRYKAFIESIYLLNKPKEGEDFPYLIFLKINDKNLAEVAGTGQIDPNELSGGYLKNSPRTKKIITRKISNKNSTKKLNKF